ACVRPPHARDGSIRRGRLRRPGRAVPLEDRPGLAHGPDIVAIGAPDPAQGPGRAARLPGPGSPAVQDRAPVPDDPGVSAEPDAIEIVGDAAGAPVPRGAVPAHDGAALSDR